MVMVMVMVMIILLIIILLMIVIFISLRKLVFTLPLRSKRINLFAFPLKLFFHFYDVKLNKIITNFFKYSYSKFNISPSDDKILIFEGKIIKDNNFQLPAKSDDSSSALSSSSSSSSNSSSSSISGSGSGDNNNECTLPRDENKNFIIFDPPPPVGTSIIVEFVPFSRYGIDGHLVLSRQKPKLAPSLYSVSYIGGEWLMVIMEKIKLDKVKELKFKKLISSKIPLSLTTLQEEKLKKSIEILH